LFSGIRSKEGRKGERKGETDGGREAGVPLLSKLLSPTLIFSLFSFYCISYFICMITKILKDILQYHKGYAVYYFKF